MENTFISWYEQNYPELSGHGVWLRGGEINTGNPNDFLNRDYKILITRLSSCRDTVDSFTHKILYQIAAKIPGAFVDLAFLPPPKDVIFFDRGQIPWLLGTSTKRDALQFDLLALSNSIVQELVNLPLMLLKSGIPLSKRERLQRCDVPLIIMGGANALNTSALKSDDPFVDGIFAGEDPASIARLFSIARNLKGKASKGEILEELQTVSGFFQPDQKKMTVKFNAPVLSNSHFLESAPVLYEEEHPGTGCLQISEGCPSFCSFCAESWGRKPYREFSSKDLLDAAVAMKASMGLNSVNLFSFNFNMHGEFYRILWNLHSVFSSVGLKSQRFDFIADDRALPGILHVAGKSSITCGLEGISTRIRSYLHKSLDDQKLRLSLNILLRAPIRELKIFLIATGLEGEDDYNEFRDLLTYITETMVSAGRRPRLIFSMTSLVRFPFTPLEFEIAAPFSVIKKITEQVGRMIRSREHEFRMSSELNEYLISQVLTRAHHPGIMNALVEACKETNFVYYEEVTSEFIASFTRHLTDVGLSLENIVSGESWTKECRVPVLTNVETKFIESITDECRTFNDNGYCMGTVDDEGSCFACGACPDDLVKGKIVAPREKSVYSAERLKSRLREQNLDSVTLQIPLNLDISKRGVSRSVVAAALARAMMLSDKRLVEGYRGFDSSLMVNKYAHNWVHGFDVLTLVWSKAGAALVNELFKVESFTVSVQSMFGGWGVLNFNDPVEVDQDVRIIISSPFSFDGSSYFKKNALKFTSRKNEAGIYCHEFTPPSRKKKLLNVLEVKKEAQGCLLNILPGEKFVLYDFLSGSFVFPSRDFEDTDGTEESEDSGNNDVVRLIVEVRKIEKSVKN